MKYPTPWLISYPDLRPVPDKSDCPENEHHTPSPSGYIAWHEWAEKMGKTHDSVKCSGCGLYKVWRKKNDEDNPDES